MHVAVGFTPPPLPLRAPHPFPPTGTHLAPGQTLPVTFWPISWADNPRTCPTRRLPRACLPLLHAAEHRKALAWVLG